MAAFHGKGGSMTFTGLSNILLLSYSVNGTADVAEITDMGDTWKTRVVGFKDWTATCECLLDGSGLGIAALGTQQTLTLSQTSGPNYAGTAILVGYSPALDANDAGHITLTFQGNGTLGET